MRSFTLQKKFDELATNLRMALRAGEQGPQLAWLKKFLDTLDDVIETRAKEIAKEAVENHERNEH